VRVEVKISVGVLAQVAAVIAELDANIDTVNIEERDGLNSALTSSLRCAIACISLPSCAGCARSSR